MSNLMKKSEMTEEDIKIKYINPSIEKSGWNINKNVKFEHCFTKGKIIVRGNKTKRGERKKADYLLYYFPNKPIAVIEAKDNNHSVGDGMQQAIEYANILNVPFAYSSNGDGFLEHDMKEGKERELKINEFPSPEELWKRYKGIMNINEEQEKWWKNREEINLDGFDKAKKYSIDEIISLNYNIDLCGYPHEEEEILPPKKLIKKYKDDRANLNLGIDKVLKKINDLLI